MLKHGKIFFIFLAAVKNMACNIGFNANPHIVPRFACLENVMTTVDAHTHFHDKIANVLETNKALHKTSIVQLSEEAIKKIAGAITCVLLYEKIMHGEDIKVTKSDYGTPIGFFIAPNVDTPKESRVFLDVGTPTKNENGERLIAVEVNSGNLCQKVVRREVSEEAMNGEHRALDSLQGKPGIVCTYLKTQSDDSEFTIYQERGHSNFEDEKFIQTLTFVAKLKVMGQLLCGLYEMSLLGVNCNITKRTVEARLDNNGVKAWISDFSRFSFSRNEKRVFTFDEIEPDFSVNEPLDVDRKSNSGDDSDEPSSSHNRFTKGDLVEDPLPSKIAIRTKTKRKISKTPSYAKPTRTSTRKSEGGTPARKGLSRTSSPQPSKHRKPSGQISQTNKPSASRAVSPKPPLKQPKSSRPSQKANTDEKKSRAVSPQPSHKPSNGKHRASKPTSGSWGGSSKPSKQPKIFNDTPRHKKKLSSPSPTSGRGVNKNQSSPPTSPVFVRKVPLIPILGSLGNNHENTHKRIASLQNQWSSEKSKKGDVRALGKVLRALFDKKNESPTDDCKHFEELDEQEEGKVLSQIQHLIEQMTNENPDERYDANEAFDYFKKCLPKYVP